jgi:hypothetical protein
MQRGYAAYKCSLDMQPGYGTGKSSMDMQYEQTARTISMDKQHAIYSHYYSMYVHLFILYSVTFYIRLFNLFYILQWFCLGLVI